MPKQATPSALVTPRGLPCGAGGSRGKRRYWTDPNDGRRHMIVRLKGWDGIVVQWPQYCTGCTEVPEMTSAPERGCGCRECGYTGRTRRKEWVPIDVTAHMAWEERVWKRLGQWRRRGVPGTAARGGAGR